MKNQYLARFQMLMISYSSTALPGATLEKVKIETFSSAYTQDMVTYLALSQLGYFTINVDAGECLEDHPRAHRDVYPSPLCAVEVFECNKLPPIPTNKICKYAVKTILKLQLSSASPLPCRKRVRREIIAPLRNHHRRASPFLSNS